MECPSLKENLDRCGCTYPACSLKGRCCECVAHHRKKKEIPGCFFPEDVEKIYDRSFARFVTARR